MITAYRPDASQRPPPSPRFSSLARCLALMAAIALPLGAAAQTQAPTPPAVLSPEDGVSFGPRWLVDLLDRLTPSIDTSLPETGAQIETRLSRKIDGGRHAEALDEIEARLALQQHTSGTNVQFLFLKARALQGLGQDAEARDLYKQLTTRYPELPEPWNNLAVLQAAAGEIDAARASLQRAVQIDPDFRAARDNLQDLYMMQADQKPAGASAATPH